MTVREAVRDALRDAGAPTNDRTVDEVIRHLPVDVEVADIVAADVVYGSTTTDVVGAIRGECRLRAAGTPSGQRVRANPTLPDPLPPPPPADVGERGLAGALAALRAAQRPTDLDPGVPSSTHATQESHDG